jgi:hypothetical protein
MNNTVNSQLRETLIKNIRAIIFEMGYSEDPTASYCIMYDFNKNEVFATQWNEDVHTKESDTVKCIYTVKGLMFSPDILAQYMGEEYNKDDYDTMLSDYLQLYGIAESITNTIMEEIDKQAGYTR